MDTTEVELRSYVRHEIQLDAILMGEAATTIPCVIVDFCPGGLFLDLEQRNTNLLPRQHQTVSIHFSTTPEFSNFDYQLEAQVTHIRSNANGMGVAFKNIPDITYQALQEPARTY